MTTTTTTTAAKPKMTADQKFWEARKEHPGYKYVAGLQPHDLHRPGVLSAVANYPDAMSDAVKAVINMQADAVCPTCGR